MTTGGYDPNDKPEGGDQGGYPPRGNPPPPPGGYPPPPGFNDQAAYGPGGRLPDGIEPGGLGLRFAARLIDGIIIGIVVILIALLVGGVNDVFIPGILSGILVFIYFVAFEVTMGATPAKKMLGLSVTAPGGSGYPTFQQSAIRNGFTLLAIIPFFIGTILLVVAEIVIAVTINSSPTKQGKHDEFAGGTQVVKR
ncbi:RDD family protein [Rhodococcus sp. NPDC057014]|uniref:RDD family protein n=1 Tax=Rhodococcus sp. NPDC057014 TaxID=3346000 RepID=UPI00363E947E